MKHNTGILLVEDNSDDASIAEYTLRRGRLANAIQIAGDGGEALRIAFGPVQPGIILLDLHLTGMSGLAVLAALKANPLTAEIPVVVLTASERPGDLAEAHRLGAAAFVMKPITYREFKTIVGQLDMPWLIRTTPPE